MKKKYNVEVKIKEYEEKLERAGLSQAWIEGYEHAIKFVKNIPWYKRLFNLFR